MSHWKPSIWTFTSDPSPSTLFGRRDKEAILQRWSEHFEGLFGDQHTVQESSLAKIPKVVVKTELDDPPTREELKKATKQLKVSQSYGIDDIPAEVNQYGGYVPGSVHQSSLLRRATRRKA